MNRFKSIVLAALAVLLIGTLAPTATASAQSSALSIAPKKNYLIEPGETVEDKLSIRNVDGNSDLNLNLRVIDFSYTDDTGTPKLMLDENAEPTQWSLKSYLKVPESTSIKAGGSESFDISVTIPENLGAGSYYSAIIYSTGAPEGGNVGLSASGVTLVFVTVPGTVHEDLTLKKFGAYNPTTKNYFNFTSNEPTVVAYTLENKGNITEAPVGSIKLRDMFGREYNIANVNPSKSLALIGQTRTYQACIKLVSQTPDFNGSEALGNTCTSAGLWPGLYTASVDLYYGQNGNMTKEITGTSYFWYLPLWFIVLVSIILLIIAFYIWRIVVYTRGGSFKLGGTPRGAGRRKSRRR